MKTHWVSVTEAEAPASAAAVAAAAAASAALVAPAAAAAAADEAPPQNTHPHRTAVPRGGTSQPRAAASTGRSRSCSR